MLLIETCMSKTNKHNNPAYISHVHLKGYKSILDTEVELHPGLNIIIGPNGSGKTNFLEFLERYITFESRGISGEFEVYLKINQDDREIRLGLKYVGLFKDSDTEEIKIEIEEIVSENISTHYLKLGEKLNKSSDFEKNIRALQPIAFISFEIPKNVEGLDSNFSIDLRKDSLKLTYWEWSPMLFINDFMLNNFANKGTLKRGKLKRKDLLETLVIEEQFKQNLRKFSVIKDVRLERSISAVEDGAFIYINQISFEFLVNGVWLNWEMLSDGTKRLFYLITQVTLNKGICLVEEPELGVHPDQYRKILNFLKEQAEDKQIIITTHAPRTLDILKNDELDQIILTKYDKELGTKMRHLSKEEIQDVIAYKEEDGSVSELWTYTGFFDEEEVI